MSEEKTFTQEQVNQIVQERLAKERERNDTALADKERELAQREFKLTAQQTFNQKGYDSTILDVLKVSNQEELEKALTTIETAFPAITNPNPVLDMPPCGAIEQKSDVPIRQAMGLQRP